MLRRRIPVQTPPSPRGEPKYGNSFTARTPTKAITPPDPVPVSAYLRESPLANPRDRGSALPAFVSLGSRKLEDDWIDDLSTTIAAGRHCKRTTCDLAWHRSGKLTARLATSNLRTRSGELGPPSQCSELHGWATLIGSSAAAAAVRNAFVVNQSPSKEPSP